MIPPLFGRETSRLVVLHDELTDQSQSTTTPTALLAALDDSAIAAVKPQPQAGARSTPPVG